MNFISHATSYNIWFIYFSGTDITDILTDIMDITDITDTFMEPMDTHGTDIMLVSDAEMDMVLLSHALMAAKKYLTNSW